jgi:hypothetical protein
MELEKFELGKCYKHNGGGAIYICGVADSIMWGTTFIAEERGSQNLTPVSMNSKDSAVNWFEITKEEFIKISYTSEESKNTSDFNFLDTDEYKAEKAEAAKNFNGESDS